MASQLSENTVRQVVREEVASEVAEIKDEQRRQGVILEDLTAKFDKNINLLTRQMAVKKRVDGHEERLKELETGQETIKSVVKIHSEQLGARA